MTKDKYTVASCSFGKDSTAMVLRLLDEGQHLDEVIFYDTGMEFDAVYAIRDKLVPVLRNHGIVYTELYPERPFLYDMLEKPVYSKKNGDHFGYGWCGGACRWGTAHKTAAIDKRANAASIHYIGIALDENQRLNRLRDPKCAPLARWGMTEADCLKYCAERGFFLEEESGQTTSGKVDLYVILKRVSCWCCANKNIGELRNIYRYLPQYWDRLESLQSKIERPMKRYSVDGVSCGSVFSLRDRFEKEAEYRV